MNYKQIGDYYYYLKPIDKGNFSLIYKGYNSKNNTPIIIKKNIKLTDTHVEKELSILQKLNHINIVKLYEHFYINNEFYFILEYCNGGNLKQYIETKEKLYDDKYVFEILSAFEYLYKEKIFHRDIKPTNFVIHNTTIKITDFGFSKILSNHLSDSFCGSPMYMSPEILQHHKYTNKSDIWSLGITFYELLLKEYPYKENIIKNIVSSDNLNIPNCGVFSDMLARMLVKNISDRIEWNELFLFSWYTERKKDDFELSFNELFTESETTERVHIHYDETFLEEKSNSVSIVNNFTGDIDGITQGNSYQESFKKSYDSIKQFFSL